MLNHNPEIYSQFGKFDLNPPVSTKEVLSVIANLKDKQVRVTVLVALIG